jgi:hypothetical protein
MARTGIPFVAVTLVRLEGVEQAVPLIAASRGLVRECGLPVEDAAFIIASEAANLEHAVPELGPGVSCIVSPRCGTYLALRRTEPDGTDLLVALLESEAEAYLLARGGLHLERLLTVNIAERFARRRESAS